eukprot:13529839-Alexandrium_andersonii.AAC.1
MARRTDGAAPDRPAKRADGSCLYCGVWVCDHMLLAGAVGEADQHPAVPSGTALGSEPPPRQLSSGTVGR